MTVREKILKDIMNRKTYVAFTPYFTNMLGSRRPLNMITLPRYSKDELFKMMDTDGAVNYMEEATQTIASFVTSLGIRPFWGNISCELSYFIDSRIYDEKNFRPEGPREGDIIRGINCVTISYSTFSDGKECINRKTFIVNLNEFVEALKQLGYIPVFAPSKIGERVVDVVLRDGLLASPELTFTKNYMLDKDINPTL